MKKFAVIGNPIAHSRSPEIHKAFAKQTNIELSYTTIFAPLNSFKQEVQKFFADGGSGLNVTVPFKEQAFILCGKNLTPRAQAAEAVNTLWQENGVLYGDNTDGAGLVYDLDKLGWLQSCHKVLILGAGGATKGVIQPLYNAGVKQITIANRTKDRADEMTKNLLIGGGLLALFDSFNLVSIALAATAAKLLADDTTPSDQVKYFNDFVNHESSPIKVVNLTKLSERFDLVINATSASLAGSPLTLPNGLTFNYAYEMAYGKPSHFTDQAKERNVPTAEGLGMLIGQAAEAFFVWNGVKPDLNHFTL